ncbi:hypothetical protein JVT61DRAFT_12387 [Boletus reticuloceps]|uniref:Uncharacterized protein n=1 Tax=Boletus reticuloceps TaxID=495285 RepID=A0A8I2YE85_9AGAM|nr:hypothetical protein JVT61DRAFT_12290 [Boletus reticuloceps]KAG6370232.1 hypothetical protein JVT61DRAFT_12387 [Boletus reticuloceps]
MSARNPTPSLRPNNFTAFVPVNMASSVARLSRSKIHGTVPEKIALGTRSNGEVVIGAGNYCSFAVDENDDVWGWGLNSMGQTGLEVSDEIQSPK